MIGEGGMGVVYACHHKTLGKQLALKVLEPKYARIPTTRSRFLSEGMIQANLAHPHIVRVIDVIDSEKDCIQTESQEQITAQFKEREAFITVPIRALPSLPRQYITGLPLLLLQPSLRAHFRRIYHTARHTDRHPMQRCGVPKCQIFFLK